MKNSFQERFACERIRISGRRMQADAELPGEGRGEAGKSAATGRWLARPLRPPERSGKRGMMMPSRQTASEDAPARLVRAGGHAPVVLSCEHAANRIPERHAGLGIGDAVRQSHVAWDPGAAAVARHLAEALDAPLVESTVSRLVHDCNRPAASAEAMPEKSEIHEIPGNRNLSEAERARRAREVYQPFHALLAETIAAARQRCRRANAPALVTIHSFTPIYDARPRSVEIGILHDADSRLADAMLTTTSAHTPLKVARNAPYGPEDGVTHTLKRHALPLGLPNVMIEIRNDLIATPRQQADIARMLATWLSEALTRTDGAEKDIGKDDRAREGAAAGTLRRGAEAG